MRPFRLALLAVVLVVGLVATASFGSPLRDQKRASTGLTSRWDIISLDFKSTPPTFNPGGVASALAADGTKLTLTGTGTFGGAPRNVTGGGNWTTYDPSGAQSGSGTYKVLSLVSYIGANLQSQTPTFTDKIGDTNKRANGTAVLRIAYSDGSQGVLTVGCHGPGAPPGIFEGVAATKGYKTYYTVQAPAAGVDANRTIFHVGV
jgi:hypothetical protein